MQPTFNFSDIEEKYKWKKSPYTNTNKIRARNIIKFKTGLAPCAVNITDECSAFEKMFDSSMIEEIVKYTNMYIMRKTPLYTRERDCKLTSFTELLALIGALILIGIKHANHANVLELWNKDGTGLLALRSIMSYKRFLFLLRSLRFDDALTRSERKETDKLAAIRFILDKFTVNCKNNYIMGEYVTIDEMLHSFRGRCGFIQYMPMKPAKYGLKVMACCDAKSYYTGNLEVYCRQQMDGPYKVSNSTLDVVKRLTDYIKNENRNLTVDNWYTSYPLASDLLKIK